MRDRPDLSRLLGGQLPSTTKPSEGVCSCIGGLEVLALRTPGHTAAVTVRTSARLVRTAAAVHALTGAALPVHLRW